MSRPSLDATYIEIAHTIRQRSTCSRGKVGAVVTLDGRPISVAYNGSQPGDPHCDDIGCDPETNVHLSGCRRTVHAELNAIIDCAKRGVSTAGTTLYCTHSPCYRCAQAIVMAGVVRFVYTTPYRLTDGYHYLIDYRIEVVQHGRPSLST
jgi:dCMP deaminase